jgi:dTDP-4-dehydrorhamnose 3,5-epimerase
MIKVTSAKIPDVKIIEPKIFEDKRGFFMESYNQETFDYAIKKKVTFTQDNHSNSEYGILRGLHFQKPPHQQGKLVRVSRGEVFDVAVDVRINSNTYGQWVAEILSEDNKKQLWIPEGFAHGFLVLSDQADFLYKTTSIYEPASEITIRWDDPTLSIDWPNIEVIISNKDKLGIFFKDLLL